MQARRGHERPPTSRRAGPPLPGARGAALVQPRVTTPPAIRLPFASAPLPLAPPRGQLPLVIRIGILGGGRIVRLAHLRNLLAAPEVRVMAIADPDATARESVARMAPGARVVADAGELLALPDLDAVVIALPTPLHREAALAAFARGLHVYLEKPIAATPDDAEAIVDAWRRAGTVGVIGFNCRFNKLYLDLRAALVAGTIGAVVAVRSALTARWPGDATWRLSPSSGGGALLELASHHVDLCRFLFDAEVVSARALTWSNRGADEAAMLQLTLARGPRVQMLCCYGTVEEDRFEVYGTRGKLVVNRYDSLVLERVPEVAGGGLVSAARHLMREVGAIRYGLEKRSAPGEEPSYRDAMLSFLGGVRSGRQPQPSLDDGLRALAAITMARASALQQDPV